MLRVAPGEVRVRLGETDLRELFHHAGPRERFGEEDDVGLLVAYLRDEPFPEGERLRVGVVDAEDPHAVVDPEPDHVEQRRPQCGTILGVEVERDDVLVFFGRVLRVRDRAVGAVPEPRRVFPDPGMVG